MRGNEAGCRFGYKKSADCGQSTLGYLLSPAFFGSLRCVSLLLQAELYYFFHNTIVVIGACGEVSCFLYQ